MGDTAPGGSARSVVAEWEDCTVAMKPRLGSVASVLELFILLLVTAL